MEAHNYVQWTLIKMLLLPCRTGWPGPVPGLGPGLLCSVLLQLVVECARVGAVGGGRGCTGLGGWEAGAGASLGHGSWRSRCVWPLNCGTFWSAHVLVKSLSGSFALALAHSLKSPPSLPLSLTLSHSLPLSLWLAGTVFENAFKY